MTEQMKAALVRACGGGVLSFLIVFVSSLQLNQGSVARLEDSLLAASAAALAYLASRGIAEGFYDGSRAAAGDVKPSDVGSGIR